MRSARRWSTWRARLGRPTSCGALTADELKARCASPAFRAGAFMRDGAQVQPALLARGLRRVLLERGVTIHEGTEVTRLDAGPPAVAVTPGGSVRAPKAVLARERVGRGLAAAAPPARRLEQLHRADGPGAREAGRDRLDGRRAGHRLPHLGSLLPDHARRPDRIRRRWRPRLEPDRRFVHPRRACGAGGGGGLSAPVSKLRRRASRGRVGRPDRRLADPPPHLRQPGAWQRLLRARLHRQRRRAPATSPARSSPTS